MIEKKIPLILLILFAFNYFFASMIPEVGKSFFYSVSLSIKEILMFVLPFIIFSFLFQGLISLRSMAFKFIILIIPAILVSGFAALQVAYFFGKYVFRSESFVPLVSSGNELKALWEIHLPGLISINMALLSGIIAGLFFSLVGNSFGNKLSKTLTHIALFFLKRIFIPIIPIFIFGFLLRISHEGYLKIIVQDYIWILFYILALIFGYITLLYLIACDFNVKRLVLTLKNMVPALVTGFSTMSSAMAMPFLIQAVEKSIPNPETGRAVIPIAINPHLIGDAISISLFSFAILLSFGHGFPSFETYVVFSMYLLIAKFGVAGIPGGGILVMAPVLSEKLGFDSTMVSLITAIYILFDPFITVGNIYGNGAFAILFSKLFKNGKRL